MQTFADRVIEFNRNLTFAGQLPPAFRVMNPFIENPETMRVMEQFYKKYYSDNCQRRLILGINPGRHGAGVTGVPFTDSKRLESFCGIVMKSAHTHEVSSVFIYDMIMAYGGVERFYRDFYINSPFPLAIIRQSESGNWINTNYYDDLQLFEMLKEYMKETLKRHIALGLDRSEIYILGKKNADFIYKINQEERLFGRLVPLEHPRYIQQYRSKERQNYIEKYLKAFGRY